MTLVSVPVTQVAVITFIGTTLEVLCVLAINVAKSVNGFLGILSTLCFIIAGFGAKDYLSIAEQIAYVITLDLPVLLSANWNVNIASRVHKFNARSWAVTVIVTIIIYLVSGYLIGHLTDDSRPWVDAINFSVSLSAGVICFLRFSNQYLWWLASGLAQLVLWFVSYKQGSTTLAMTVNSSIYLISDVLAFIISPWYGECERQRLSKEEAAYAKGLGLE